MSFLWKRLEGCCYFLSLRAGALILLWLFLIAFTLFVMIETAFVNNDLKMKITTATTWMVVGIIPAAVALYGAYRNELEYLLPFIIVAVILIIVSLFSVVILTFVWITSPETVLEYVKKRSAKSKSSEVIREEATMFVWSFDFSIIVMSLFIWYCMNVVRSFYLQLRDGESRVSHASSFSIPPTSHQQVKN